MSAAVTVATPTDREIVITRTLNAPRPLVWDAMHMPEFLRRWMLGPPGWEMTACENDVRVGGRFRHEWKNVDGKVMAMSAEADAALDAKQRAAIERKARIVSAPIANIELCAGGSVRCMIAELHLPRTH